MRKLAANAGWGALLGLMTLFVLALTPLRDSLPGGFVIFPGIPMMILGILLALASVAQKEKALLKGLLIAAGISAAGWPASLLLHRFLYNYFPSEAVTYILFFLVFPFTFVIAAAGSIIYGAILGVGRRKGISTPFVILGKTAGDEPEQNQDEDQSRAQRLLEEGRPPEKRGFGFTQMRVRGNCAVPQVLHLPPTSPSSMSLLRWSTDNAVRLSISARMPFSSVTKPLKARYLR